MCSAWIDALENDGYVTLPGVFSPGEVRAMLAGLESALSAGTADDPAIRGGEGTVYAARNVLRLWPGAARWWPTPATARRRPRPGTAASSTWSSPPARRCPTATGGTTSCWGCRNARPTPPALGAGLRPRRWPDRRSPPGAEEETFGRRPCGVGRPAHSGGHDFLPGLP